MDIIITVVYLFCETNIIIIKTELKDLGLNSRQISRMRTCHIFVDILLSSVLVSQKELPTKEEG